MTTTFDLIVAGGGLGGCFSALAAAGQGKKVALVEHRPYLGYEWTAKSRLWLGREGYDSWPASMRGLFVPEDERGEIGVPEEEWRTLFPEEVPLFAGTVKKQLLNRLLEQGVRVFLTCSAAGVAMTGGQVSGLVMANKFGMQLLKANRIVDATEYGTVARMVARDSLRKPLDEAQFAYVLEFTGVEGGPAMYMDAAPSLALAGDRIGVHPGKGGNGHVYAEFAVHCGPFDWTSEARMRAENLLRDKAVEVTRYLREHVAGFGKASLHNLAEEGRLVGDCCGVCGDAGLDGLHVLPAAAWAEAATCRDIQELQGAVERKTASVMQSGGTSGAAQEKAGSAPVLALAPEVSIPLSACTLRETEDHRLKDVLLELDIPVEAYMQSSASADVLVAGGGTSGAVAGLAAAGEGRSVVMLESMAELGGTKTVGLVTGYYKGNQIGYTKQLELHMAEMSQRLYGTEKSGGRTVRMLHYRSSFLEKGGRLFARTQLCGSRVSDGKITSVLAADEFGLKRFTASVYIDGTGDGDLAAFCGETFEFGAGDMQITQNYSQWSMSVRPVYFKLSTTHKDNDVIYNTLLSEWLRGLYVSHRLGGWYNFASLLTVRESRRIVGRYTITLRDALGGSRHPDTIAVGHSDFDPHSYSYSVFSRMGFRPIHDTPCSVEIPLRSCLPLNTRNLIVSCKAISSDWEAFNYVRMSADLQNLGFAAGLIAADAVSRSADLHQYKAEWIRERLIREELIPGGDIDHGRPAVASDEQYAAQLAEGREDALFPAILFGSDKIKPLLEKAFLKRTDANALVLAKALAWFGSKAGLDVLLEALERADAATAYISYNDMHPYANGYVKAGIIDEIDDYWQLNQLVVLLGRLGAKEALPLVCRILDRTISGGPPVNKRTPYMSGRTDQQRIPNYDRALALCFYLQHNPDPSAVSYLEQLMDREYMSGYVSAEMEEGGNNFYSAVLELRLAEALALCGGKRGLAILAGYLEDVHDHFTRFAHERLKKLTGLNRGRSAEEWADLREGIRAEAY